MQRLCDSVAPNDHRIYHTDEEEALVATLSLVGIAERPRRARGAIDCRYCIPFIVNSGLSETNRGVVQVTSAFVASRVARISSLF